MPRPLTSWKQIADYLGKSIRTVQRWERELGLPVRRPDAKRDRVVFVLPEELDAWMRAMPLAAAPAAPQSDGDAGPPRTRGQASHG